MRRIPFPNLHNLRDLGGYACPGGMTRFGVFFRSDMPRGAEIARGLAALGITDIVDLRSGEEKGRDSSSAQDFPDLFRWHDVPLFSELDPTITKGDSRVAAVLYENLLDNSGEYVAKVMDILANAQGPALFHCFAGKDRTGVTAALLLHLLGVAREDIVADYQVTFTYMKAFFATLPVWNEESMNGIFSSHPESMEYTLDCLEKKYHGAENYLLQNGVSPSAIQSIKSKFLQPL